MIWLIDGYNVIRRDPELSGLDRRSLEEGRTALLRALASLARTSRDNFVVVFDGVRISRSAVGVRTDRSAMGALAPRAAVGVRGGAVMTGRAAAVSGPQVRAVFSRPPDKADDVLVRMARERGAGATVVTSDRAVQAAAQRVRAAAVSADAFLERLGGAEPEAASSGDDGDPGEPPRRDQKKGNPRRLSRRARQARHALSRLRPPRA